MTTEIRVNGTKIEFIDSEVTVATTLKELADAVKLTGNETVAGIKTFSSSPIVPTPTTDMQTSTKLYVDIGTLYATTINTSATPTPARASKRNLFTVTALAAATATFAVPSGTALEGDTLLIRIKDNGTARILAWNAIYRIIGTTLPLITVLGKTLYLLFVYNFTDTKWDCLATGQEA